MRLGRIPTMPPLPEGNTRLYRASVSPREGTTVRELTLISSTIKFNPKHDLLVDMTMLVCQYVEKMIRINRLLCLVSRRSFPIDQPITLRAIFKTTHPSFVRL